jgi:diaminohydroxyphosphoribosylaminopyrimidine deaminase/5-amino-6-(5-phosphoribosylamino)uracil reductase
MSDAFSKFDHEAMARAIELAKRGLETTHPNPRVGCVIARGDKIIAEGWHERPGGPHAEAMALKALPGGAKGATVYVTLEPCSHFGRTAPCATALVDAKVSRVVFALQDPNPQVSGGGAAMLQSAGIKVESGLMQSEAEELNLGFLKRMRTGTPFVRVKLGMSLDGRTALATGASKWITSEASREDVQKWRAQSSAIMTGVGTMLADDPQLDVRIPGVEAPERPPMRVILDSDLRTPPSSKIFSTSGDVVIFTASTADTARCAELGAKGAGIEFMPRNAPEIYDVVLDASGEPEPQPQEATMGLALDSVLARLGELEVNELLVESGAKLAGALIRHKLVDELLLYMAPKLLGHQARALVEFPELANFAQSPRFSIFEMTQIGVDLRLRLRP